MNTRRILLISLVAASGIATWVFRDRIGTSEHKTTIKLIGEAYAPLDALAKLASDFEHENKVKIEVTQKDHQSVVAELDQELASGNISYDVILMPHRLLGRLVEKGQVQDLSPLVTDAPGDLLNPNDAYDRWWKEVSWYKGRPYGAPFTLLTMYVAYRKDLMELPENMEQFKIKYGRDLAVPTTWKEYEELAAFFHRPERGLNGTFVEGQQHVALWYEWLNVLYAFGADVLDTDGAGSSYGSIVVNSPKAKEATEAYLRLLDYSPKESTNYNWDDALAVMQSGKAFMGLMWHDTVPYLEDAKQSPLAGKFGYFLLPSVSGKPVSQLEGWSYLVPKGAAHPKEAARFIEWAMSPSIQLKQTMNGGASPRRSVYKDADVAKIPFMPTFLKALESGVVKPTFPESGAVSEALVRRLSEILNRKIGVSEGLDQAAADLEKILGKKAIRKY